jgi:hypothetical protein
LLASPKTLLEVDLLHAHKDKAVARIAKYPSLAGEFL